MKSFYSALLVALFTLTIIHSTVGTPVKHEAKPVAGESATLSTARRVTAVRPTNRRRVSTEVEMEIERERGGRGGHEREVDIEIERSRGGRETEYEHEVESGVDY